MPAKLVVKRRSKYRNVPVLTSVGRFDSKREYARFCDLKVMEKAGAIAKLSRQTRMELRGADGSGVGFYFADFCYLERGKLIYEDCKSPVSRTAVYKLKKKLLAAQGLAIRET